MPSSTAKVASHVFCNEDFSTLHHVSLLLFILLFHTVALEVHGNERPLLVGLEPVIRCSTHLRATKLEWLLVGLDFTFAVSHTQEVSLSLELLSDSLDGAMFKCRAATLSGAVYEETITIAVKGIFPVDWGLVAR